MSDMIFYKNGEETFRISPPTVGTKCPETKLEVKKMTDPDIIKECRQTGRTRTTTKNLLEKAYYEQMTKNNPAPDIIEIGGVKYQKVEEEPEVLKTLYDALQLPSYTNGYHFNEDQKDWICDIVKSWMSQYADNVMTGEYLKGYEECLTVLEENLK